ncbi:N-acetylglucosamine kinase-like BadF-type ATPase [Neobacillus niacini]|uniref:N-acetylglucosamine kinase n=1 Tax=Neobacillus niacini TaxID=86668 RepID=UPI002858E441|nr:BadF/BadG/BcrA/BcrD ATPase family protein [Neobacillus niacini]MDR7075875.1 N-acetylglucosamine kinase-like BadF-type ATPase [Neobacillus niacini]
MNKNTIELLAVDGGGTKTRAVLVEADGTILGEGKAGASNYHVVGAEGAKKTLVEAVLAAFNDAGIEPDHTVKLNKAVFALAGIDTVIDEKEVAGVVQRAVTALSIEIGRLLVENDCLSTLLGATQNNAGILLIAGTGSIIFAHDGNNRIVRSGGWGHRVGDEGSGYWIGKQAIQAVLKMVDGRGEETLLSKLILEKFNFNKIEDLYNWTYSDSYSVDEVGALAAVVDEAFRLGDTVSKRILDAAVSELLLLIETAIEKADIQQDEFDMIFQGGVFHHNHYIKNQVCQRIQQSTTKVKIRTTTEEPISNIIKRGLVLI